MQKYKVFMNDNWIFFGNKLSNQFSENEPYDIVDVNKQIIVNLVQTIKAESFHKNLVLIHPDKIEEFFLFFLNQFMVIEAAGGIVQHTDKRFLMIKRFGFWDFPKGKIEKGEKKEQAALREVWEETGVKELRIFHDLTNTYHIYKFKAKWIVKLTYWFLMKTNFKENLIPQVEEDITEVVWVSKSEFPRYLQNAYKSLQDLVNESNII